MGFYVLLAQCQELAGLIELGGEKFFCTSAYNQLPKILKSESFRDFAGCSKNCFFNDEEKRDMQDGILNSRKDQSAGRDSSNGHG